MGFDGAQLSVPLWSLVQSRNEFGDLSLPILTVTSEFGVGLRDLSSGGRAVAEDLSGYRVVRPGDLVVNKMWARFGAYGVSREAGLISPAYWVLRIDERRAYPGFVHYLLRSDTWRGEIWRRSKDLPPNGFDISWDQFRILRLDLPPLDEQRRIADFLDDQVARINEARLLRSKQLELLDEMRSASLTRILHSAPGRPMRIAWLLKRSPSYGVLKPEHYDGPDGVPIVRIFNMPKHGEIDVAELMRISPGQDKEYARTRLAPGDVLLSVVGTIGRVAIVGDALNGANLSRAVARLEPRAPWQAPLIATWLQSQGFARFVDETTQGTAQSVLNMGDLARFQIVMPESREIALKVADKAVEHLRDGQDVTAGVRRAMEILEEYRSSLITAAVTGEFDVTTARRGIPA